MINKDILSYIPQRAPMVMITEIKGVSQNGIITSFKIDDKNIFCSGGLFREPGLIENIAQSAAARIGYICDVEKKTIPLGFIGAIKNLIIHKIPKVGDELNTTVTIEHEVMNATIISGKIECRGELIAGCNMNIFLQEEDLNGKENSDHS